jgi:hypothetical protein
MPLPKWEQLSEALQRVTGRGVTEKKAKRDICNSITDRKIRLRLLFRWRPTSQDFLTLRDQPAMEVHEIEDNEIPTILNLGDFDWSRSRIKKPGLWQNVRGPSGSLFANWRVIETAHYGPVDPFPLVQRGGRSLAYQHRLELRKADVTKVFSIRKQPVPAVREPESGERAKQREIDEHVPAGPKPTIAGHSENSSHVRRRGPRATKLEQTKEKMRRDIREGRQTTATLNAMLEKNLASSYSVSRDTARKARDAVLSEIGENSIPDK